MSTLKQRQQVQAEIGVARDLIDYVEMALIGEYDNNRSREVLLYARVALPAATQRLGNCMAYVGEALSILDDEEKNAATVDRPATGEPVAAKQKDGSNRLSARPARAR